MQERGWSGTSTLAFEADMARPPLGHRRSLEAMGLAPHAFVTSMAAYGGRDPAKDIEWVMSPSRLADAAFCGAQDRRFLLVLRRSHRNRAHAKSVVWGLA
jgi:hypothetical protein